MNLSDDLRALGLTPGGIAMVHASMRVVGGRAEALVDALLAVLGPAGTLMAYVDFEPDAEPPFFDPARSPAATAHGVFAEVLRRWPGAVRSLNPGASMAAVGARAAWLCADHPLRFGYGPDSPLGKLVSAGGQVLLLGSDPDQVTLLHLAEHLADLPGKRVVRSEVHTPQGPLAIEEFDTSRPVVAAMPEGCFARLTRAFVESGAARSGPVGGAASHVLPAPALVQFAVHALERDFGARCRRS